MNHEISERARSLFNDSGFYCAESVLMALAEHQGIQSEIIPKVASCFCSGIARSGELCGAVSGAIMGIGLALGRSTPDRSLDPAYTATRQFTQAFEVRFGSLNCQELTGCHLGTPAGQDKFKAENIRERCEEYVAQAAYLASEAIEHTN